jgi:spore germination protein YaaH
MEFACKSLCNIIFRPCYIFRKFHCKANAYQQPYQFNSGRGANGVNIDFEGLPSAQKTNFTNFMIDLCNAFHTQIPGSQVSVCLYAVDWSSVFDIATLKNYVDLFCIMGYDYYYSGSSTAGPSSPLYSLTSSYNYNVSKSITYYLSAGVPNNKLVLGLPYYGEEWSTSSSSVPSSTTSTGSAKFYNTVRNNASGYYTAANKHFNDNSYVPYYAYNNGTTWKQCWIDDAYSLGKKMELFGNVELPVLVFGHWAMMTDIPICGIKLKKNLQHVLPMLVPILFSIWEDLT